MSRFDDLADGMDAELFSLDYFGGSASFVVGGEAYSVDYVELQSESVGRLKNANGSSDGLGVRYLASASIEVRVVDLPDNFMSASVSLSGADGFFKISNRFALSRSIVRLDLSSDNRGQSGAINVDID